jgi:hypothetical protein
VPLHHSVALDALVLNDAPVAVRLELCVLPSLLSPGLPQNYDPANRAMGTGQVFTTATFDDGLAI